MSTARAGLTGCGLTVEFQMYHTPFWTIMFAVGEEIQNKAVRSTIPPPGE